MSGLEFRTGEEQTFAYLMVLWTRWCTRIFWTEILFHLLRKGFQMDIACIRYMQDIHATLYIKINNYQFIFLIMN